MDSIVVSVVIPVLNQFAMTRECLRSLQKHAPEAPMEVVVVDNGSTDETVAGLEPLGRNLFGEAFTRIRFERNRNFGPACNAGARAARGGFLFFLNNDTLLTPGWLPPLLAGIEGGDAAVGPLLLYPPTFGLLGDRVQHLGICCQPSLHMRHLHEFFPGSHPLARKMRSLQFITGAALLLRREVFEQAGMFHEAYVNGGEDLDLCVQIQRRGGAVRCIPESCIHHYQSQTEGRFAGQHGNLQVFKERCQPFIAPDLHLQLASDGYEMGLNANLEPVARLPARRRALLERALFRDSPAPDAAACQSLLEREPLFLPAYERLADIYASTGQHALLVQLRYLQSRLFPDRAAGVRLMEAARLAGDEAMEKAGRSLKNRMDQAEADDGLCAQAEATARFASELGQPNLARTYAEWSRRRMAGSSGRLKGPAG